MTYCVGISVKSGLVLASDSRTNAGSDQVSQYGKMHTMGIEGERQFVLLSAGNLATTQAVLTHIRHELTDNPECNLYNSAGLPASPFRTDEGPGVTAGAK